jgi:hypothetical protein
MTTNDAAERAVSGLPPDLSSGMTLTDWECEQKVAAERRATVERYEPVFDIVKRHTHQGAWAMTRHAGPDPENDCLLCRALVAAGVLTLDGIGAGTRRAILDAEADR